MRLLPSLLFRRKTTTGKDRRFDFNFTDSNGDVVFAHAVITGKFIIINPSSELSRITGFRKSQLRGNSLGKILSHPSAVNLRSLIASISVNHPFVTTEVTLIRKDLSTIPMEIVVNLYRKDYEDQLFCIFRNLNPDRRMIAELFTAKEHFRLLAENTSYVQILLDANLKSIYISPSCLYLSGYTNDEARRMNLFNLVHPDDFHLLWDALNTEVFPANNLRFRFRDNEGHDIPVECQINKVLDSFGQPEFFVLNLHDISRQKMYEQELIRARKEAEASHRMKNDFLASITHELRTPLNAIIGFARILEPRISENENSKLIQHIESSGMQLLGLIDNMLEYARLENNQIELQKQRFRINEFFRELAPIVRNDIQKFQKENLEIICAWDSFNSEAEIITNQQVVKDIFINLLENAIKFTREGYVRYGCRPYGIGYYLFFVEDSGIGIPEDFKELIFEKFTQVDQSLTREFGGAGLGLTVSKKLIELLGGEIWVMTNKDQGSSFFFTLPDGIHRG
jgi:PAS domain S-box-containing protein